MDYSTPDPMQLFELGNGQKISVTALQGILPDVESTLFFAKVYGLSARKLGELLSILWQTTVVTALTSGEHSTSLQDYIVSTVPDHVATEVVYTAEAPDITADAVLPLLWEDAMLEVADSIKEVAAKLVKTIGRLPSKQGRMIFRAMRTMNKNRPTLGTFKAAITHQAVPDVLVILDDSGSMSRQTIEALLEDVIGMSWKANAHLVLVSDSARHWQPGGYDVTTVLAKVETRGTHYEQLIPLLNQDWGTVITIADYDSSWSAKDRIAQCTGRIGKVYDISLVSRSTFLAECLGQLADSVEPLLIAAGDLTRSHYSW